MISKKLVRQSLCIGSKVWVPLKVMCLQSDPLALCHDVNVSLNDDMEQYEHIAHCTEKHLASQSGLLHHGLGLSDTENEEEDTDFTESRAPELESCCFSSG